MVPTTSLPKPVAEPSSLVSIIVPCFKMGHYIDEALHSVGCQTYIGWELIAVDDFGPDDGTREAVESFAARFQDHRVEYIRHERNCGVSAARNTAIATAKGEFLAFLDPDDAWLPGHLTKSIAAFFTKAADVSVVTSPVEIFWDKKKQLRPHRWVVENWKRERFPESLAIDNFIPPSATLVRRDVLMQAGGFDISPALQHIEDYDLWIRLAEKGYRFVFLDDVTARYRKHETAATADLEKGRERNNVLCARHASFFLRMQGKLIQDMHEEIQRTYEEITRLKSAMRNPIRWLAMQARRRLIEAFSRLKA